MKRKLGDRVSEYASVPKETLMDLTKLSFGENRELYIENHKGIEQYTSECIKIKAKFATIKIQGFNFKISYINKYDVLLEGIFHSVTFEH